MSDRPDRWALATADVAGVSLPVLEDVEGLAVRLGRRLAGAIGEPEWQLHRFVPHGASLVGVSPRGRIIVHTWPERGALTLDLYAAPADAERLLGESVEEVTGATSTRASDE